MDFAPHPDKPSAGLPFQYVQLSTVTDSFTHRDKLMALMNVCGFFLCQQGTVDVSLNEQTYHIQAGDIYFYTPSTYVSVLSYSADLRGVTFKCQMDFILPLLERLVNGRNILQLHDHPCITLTPVQQRRIEELSACVVEHLTLMDQPADNAMSAQVLVRLLMSLGESLFNELIYAFSCNQSMEPEIKDGKDRVFQTFLVSLLKNYKQQREVTYYAREQCLSPRYFSSIIKEKSGHSALQWIIQMVISSARQLLENTDMSIKEMAAEFHFPSQSFFGKYFKQYVGVSPKEYRRQMHINKLRD